MFRIEVNHVKSGIFFPSKRNEIFASISNFASEAKVRAHPSPHRWLWKWIHPQVHTLLVVERDTPTCLHCWMLTRETQTIHSPCPHPRLWKWINPRVHTLLVMKGDTPLRQDTQRLRKLKKHPHVHTAVPEFLKGSFSAWKQAENANFWKRTFSPRDKRRSET